MCSRCVYIKNFVWFDANVWAYIYAKDASKFCSIKLLAQMQNEISKLCTLKLSLLIKYICGNEEKYVNVSFTKPAFKRM